MAGSRTLDVTHTVGKLDRRTARRDEFDRVQRLINEVQVDLVNGVSRSDIFRKFKEREYENLSERAIGERQVRNYIKAAWELIKEDRVEKTQELRDLLYSQYLELYREAMEVGNTIAAKSCLDSIAKIFLPQEPLVNVTANNCELSIDFNLNGQDET